MFPRQENKVNINIYIHLPVYIDMSVCGYSQQVQHPVTAGSGLGLEQM